MLETRTIILVLNVIKNGEEKPTSWMMIRLDECFRKYDNVLDSYSDHSMFLFSRSRYAALFQLPINDYKGWCYGLKKAGYATDPKYPERLIELIEKYNLTRTQYCAIESTPLHKSTERRCFKIGFSDCEKFIDLTTFVLLLLKDNDSFYKIAHDFNLELEEILEYNDLSKSDKLSIRSKNIHTKKNVAGL
jgi:hypothetical protein